MLLANFSLKLRTTWLKVVHYYMGHNSTVLMLGVTQCSIKSSFFLGGLKIVIKHPSIQVVYKEGQAQAKKQNRGLVTLPSNQKSCVKGSVSNPQNISCISHDTPKEISLQFLIVPSNARRNREQGQEKSMQLERGFLNRVSLSPLDK